MRFNWRFSNKILNTAFQMKVTNCVKLVKNQEKIKRCKASTLVGITRFWEVQVLHCFFWHLPRSFFSFFLFTNHAKICYSVSAVFASTVFACLGTGVHSATATLLWFCGPSFGVSPGSQFLRQISCLNALRLLLEL